MNAYRETEENIDITEGLTDLSPLSQYNRMLQILFLTITFRLPCLLLWLIKSGRVLTATEIFKPFPSQI